LRLPNALISSRPVPMLKHGRLRAMVNRRKTFRKA
jgi:hypothetical protein